jgi:hypothetical protein
MHQCLAPLSPLPPQCVSHVFLFAVLRASSDLGDKGMPAPHNDHFAALGTQMPLPFPAPPRCCALPCSC